MRIECFEELESTNIYIRRYLGGGENRIVCAKRQSAGRGTKGRSFLSNEGGIYLSALFYPDLPASQAFRLMSHAAVAVCRTIRHYRIEPSVKWPNDVLIGEKKCCGILIENVLQGSRIHESIIGIGINVTNDVSAIGGIACSLRDVVANCPRAEEVREELISNLLRESDFEEYLSYVGFLNRTIRVIGLKESYFAVAKGITKEGKLEIERDGKRAVLSSEEISIQLGEAK